MHFSQARKLISGKKAIKCHFSHQKSEESYKKSEVNQLNPEVYYRYSSEGRSSLHTNGLPTYIHYIPIHIIHTYRLYIPIHANTYRLYTPIRLYNPSLHTNTSLYTNGYQTAHCNIPSTVCVNSRVSERSIDSSINIWHRGRM